ncbi:hypothetical protein QFZ66_001699 [Streptomyces sp. B4I13]|uniref:hypothetical protein n=1 Tax=Streptomyces sp. B4I13 TaxID=3042271 RepID=UPI002789CB28|nr:hypothetical protein [Streptomyces sp. B4I13]MDQ0957821.1 hypothetical protein [Streptomyces sp. B4I13]
MVQPSQRMRELGVVQYGTPDLAEPVRPLDLPAERDAAERCFDQLYAEMELIGQVHPFTEGMGLAAPQSRVFHRQTPLTISQHTGSERTSNRASHDIVGTGLCCASRVRASAEGGQMDRSAHLLVGSVTATMRPVQGLGLGIFPA